MQQLLAHPLIAPTSESVLVIDDTGNRKDGCFTDHVVCQCQCQCQCQCLGLVGKIDNGIVAVNTLWANDQR
ncbi:hypothetical protein [Noviherbaspirillum album]|uniref:hypothetical protein n=1 Tax=Noviherbaspirillum album TaxID=3080276 RepID=UPI003F589C8C